jgi:polar amino acid transport system permease protein
MPQFTKYTFDWSIVLTDPYPRLFINGIKITFLLFFVSSLLSLLLGTVISIFRVSRIRSLRFIGFLYIKIFQSIPVLFWILFFYFVFPGILPANLEHLLNSYTYYPVIAGILVLTLDNASYVSDILKNGKQLIPHIQREVAISTGLNRVQQYMYVLLPQIFRVTVPSLGTRLVHNFKNTTLCMAIAAPELMWATQQFESLSFRGIEAIILATVFYGAVSIIIASITILLEHHLKIDAANIIKLRT